MAGEQRTLIPPTNYDFVVTANSTTRLPLTVVDTSQATQAVVTLRIHWANWQGSQVIGLDYQLCGYTDQDPIEQWQGNPFVALLSMPFGTTVPAVRAAPLPTLLPSAVTLFLRATQTSFGATLRFICSGEIVLRRE